MWDRWGPTIVESEEHVQQFRIERTPTSWAHPLDPSVIGEHVEFQADRHWPVWGWRSQFIHTSKVREGGAYVAVPHAATNMPAMAQPVGEILRRFPWGG